MIDSSLLAISGTEESFLPMTENENSNVAGQYFCTPCHYMRYTSKESSSHRQNHVISASHRSRKALDRITYSSSPPWAMNLLAGAERYPYRHFLLYDVTGETLGAAIPLSLGYAFAACLKAGANLLSIFSAFALMRFLAIQIGRAHV